MSRGDTASLRIPYENLDLLVYREGDAYCARVLHSPAGEGQKSYFSFPFTRDELETLLGRAPGESRRVVPTEGRRSQPLTPRELGARLYEAAFAGEVGECLRRSLDVAQVRDSGLRLRLRLDSDLPELADLPWEYLFVPEPQPGRFLALSNLTPIVRYIEMGERVQPLRVIPPLTILAAIADPSDLPRLAVEQEWARLRDALSALAGRGLVRLERLARATLPALQERLRGEAVHILHFVGHGFFDAEQSQGGLAFEDEAGLCERVPAERLGMLLHDHTPLRLAFLNACEGARGGREDAFAGVAQRLIWESIPAVLAMQFPVSDAAAIALAQTFYGGLAGGLPADTALGEARKAIEMRGNALEWGTPVLFSRSDDNRLIELPQGDARPIIETKDYEPETVLIPGGPFLMGSPPGADIPDHETPQHTVTLPDYRIGRYPVTVREFAAYVQDARAIEWASSARAAGWFNLEPPEDRLDYPVTSVSWGDALAYCAWLSARTGRAYRLPSEAEWEKAAVGVQGLDKGTVPRYPWGDAWEPRCANAESDGTTPVTAHPAGASAYGVEDLLGNVQEWTRTLRGARPGQPDYAYPYRADDGREAEEADELPAQARIVHRGGSFRSAVADLRCAARGSAAPDSRIAWRGFRVALGIV